MATPKSSLRDYAEYVVHYMNVSGMSISHLKLQKLLYYLQGWSAARLPEPLWTDEPEAWVNGPVYTPVYRMFRGNGNAELSCSNDLRDAEQQLFELTQKLEIDSAKKQLIEGVLNHFGKFSAIDLVLKTHQHTPWLTAREGLDDYEPSSTKIKLDDIKSFFVEIERKRAA